MIILDSLKSASGRLQFATVVILVCSVATIGTSRQAKLRPPSQRSSNGSEEAILRDQIRKLIRDTVQEGKGVTPEGIKYRTRVPPSNEAVEEVRGFGDKAIPVLTEYLWSRDTDESAVAMRFLGALGGKRIVAPLRQVIRQHPSPAARISAMRWLREVPCELAAPVLREAAERDSDPSVRRKARDLLSAHACGD